MTIDEAIARAREKADKNNACWKYCTDIKDCKTCEKENEQLVEWLEELKEARRCMEENRKAGYNNGFTNCYNKAIDDFMIAIICELKNKHMDIPIVDIFGNREKWREKNLQYLEFENLVYKIAESLKVCVKEMINDY